MRSYLRSKRWENPSMTRTRVSDSIWKTKQIVVPWHLHLSLWLLPVGSKSQACTPSSYSLGYWAEKRAGAGLPVCNANLIHICTTVIPSVGGQGRHRHMYFSIWRNRDRVTTPVIANEPKVLHRVYLTSELHSKFSANNLDSQISKEFTPGL